MAKLPTQARSYGRTRVFSEATVPPGLIRAHATKAGSWGVIHVLEGALAYRITDPRRPGSEEALAAGGAPGVIEPTVQHEVAPLGAVRFFVEFCRSGPEDAEAG
ncbi:MAG: DUF1971 domain-containing protein [Caulobacteraceae bacterium]